jgi:hypothetical protein
LLLQWQPKKKPTTEKRFSLASLEMKQIEKKVDTKVKRPNEL